MYSHVSAVKRQKLDDRSKKFIFVGYDGYSNGYKLLVPSNGNVSFSRVCHFEEGSVWDWHDQSAVEHSVPVTLSCDFSSPVWGADRSTEEPEIALEEGRNEAEVSQQLQSAFGSDVSSPRHPRIRTLQELYEVTNDVGDNVTLFCLFTDCEPLNYEEAVKNKVWS